MSVEDIFDVTRNVAISSPAGSGKTEKLARRYISLVVSGAEIEKIVAFTFTEKAAQEMKERVFKILKSEHPDIWRGYKDTPHRFRISTIHSFLRGMLLRFPYEALVDPEFEMLDETQTRLWFDEIIHDSLIEISRNQESEEHKTLKKLFLLSGNSWANLKSSIKEFFAKRPFSEAGFRAPSLPELFSNLQGDVRDRLEHLAKAGNPELLPSLASPLLQGGLQDIGEELAKTENDLRYLKKMFLTQKNEAYKKHKPGFGSCPEIFISLSNSIYHFSPLAETLLNEIKTFLFNILFKRTNERYEQKKMEAGGVDFADLETKALKLINENERCFEILLAFEENTDHILVDEFQDTNSFQWEIIKKFTEDWRSGHGYKMEKGVTSTIFLVGDPKQSIYLFRGANVEVFEKAKRELKNYAPKNFVFYEPPENYRSLQSIIDFSNFFFSKIMKRNNEEELWRTIYSPFEKKRALQDKGMVELLLTSDPELKKKKDRKRKEAETIAKRIKSLIRKEIVFDKSSLEEAEKKRALRYEEITILLRARTYLPEIEQALREYKIPYFVLKGVGFWESPEISLVRSFLFFLTNPFDDLSLYTILKSPFFNFEEEIFLKARFENGKNLFEQAECLLKKEKDSRISDFELLKQYLSKVDTVPVSYMIEQFFKDRNGWEFLWEPQQAANIKKFIKILEGYDKEG